MNYHNFYIGGQINHVNYTIDRRTIDRILHFYWGYYNKSYNLSDVICMEIKRYEYIFSDMNKEVPINAMSFVKKLVANHNILCNLRDENIMMLIDILCQISFFNVKIIRFKDHVVLKTSKHLDYIFLRDDLVESTDSFRNDRSLHFSDRLQEMKVRHIVGTSMCMMKNGGSRWYYRAIPVNDYSVSFNDNKTLYDKMIKEAWN